MNKRWMNYVFLLGGVCSMVGTVNNLNGGRKTGAVLCKQEL